MKVNKQKKSSSFMSVFSIFKCSNNKQRGGRYNVGAYEDWPNKYNKVWPSDEDRGCWGVTDPVIDMRATTSITQYKKRISESGIHCQAQDEQTLSSQV